MSTPSTGALGTVPELGDQHGAANCRYIDLPV